ncbi:hypothetical protein D7Y23_33240 [Corallococcus sp. AB050B]|nr:hypothetical protein D7Y23_33240 [Corallococcus sp. AB050B]
MSAELQSGYAAFQPRARLLKLIGAELISDDVVAIVELVKNAHDADASTVTIRFAGASTGEGEIHVIDDGHGMDRDTLLGGWMEPAGSTKGALGKRVSARGRRVLGEKGLGRFAADKLGRHLELLSRRPGSAAEIRAVFDWDQFDSDTRMLGEIRSHWEIRPATELAKQQQGTILRIRGLRATWTERMFRRLCNRLARLRSPLRDRSDFSIHIESDEFPEYSGELVADYFNKAPYKIDARFDGQDTIELRFGDEPAARQRWTGPGALSCGPVRVRLHAFDLETEALARIGSRTDVRAWLREWSGVSVYRDGYRVWPYGEPHDDWLRLDQRRVNNPVLRLSNNQVVGFVEITQDANPELRDQTNREGMVNTPALEDLRALIHHVLMLLETRRQSIRHAPPSRVRPATRSEEPQESPVVALEKLAASAGKEMGAELRRIAGRLKEQAQKDGAYQKRFMEGYTELAAVGQAALGVTHELPGVLQRVHEAVRLIRQQPRSVGDNSGGLLSLEEALVEVEDRVDLLASLEKGNLRKRRTIEVPAELRSFESLVRPLVEAQGVVLAVKAPEKGLIRADMSPQGLHRVLHVLVTNSLDWLHGVAKPKIKLKVAATEDECIVTVSDNGPGIPDHIAPDVFEPMITMKEGGRGMGLTIARQIVSMHLGRIELMRPDRGAAVRFTLPRKRGRNGAHGD